MTPRTKAFYHLSVAYAFADAACKLGFKYEMQRNLILKSLDELKKKMSDKQIRQGVKEAEDTIKNRNGLFSYYDFLDRISWAIDIISKGRDRRINSWLALAASRAPEIEREKAG